MATECICLSTASEALQEQNILEQVRESMLQLQRVAQTQWNSYSLYSQRTACLQRTNRSTTNSHRVTILLANINAWDQGILTIQEPKLHSFFRIFKMTNVLSVVYSYLKWNSCQCSICVLYASCPIRLNNQSRNTQLNETTKNEAFRSKT